MGIIIIIKYIKILEADKVGNIISYVKENGFLTFDAMDFNEVDSLVLSQLSYLCFDSFIESVPKFDITFKDLAEKENRKELLKNIRTPKQNHRLLDAVAESERFGNIGIGIYVNEIEKEIEKQFSAVTFKLSSEKYYIAFRGTDKSLIGWKEDFNMSYLKNVPAQDSALCYFKSAAEELDGVFILGGHSKGGNLSVYAAANADEDEFLRIEKIYNHDGPGFRDNTLSQEKRSKLSDIVLKTVPKASVVGLMLESDSKYKVVFSKSLACNQHNPFTWSVKADSFVFIKETDMFSRFSKTAVDKWLENNDDETVSGLINYVYDLIKATGSDTVAQLIKNWNKNIRLIYNEIKISDPELKKLAVKALHDFIVIFKDILKGKRKYR